MCLDYTYTNHQQHVLIGRKDASRISAFYALLSGIFMAILYYARYTSIDAKTFDSTRQKVDEIDNKLTTTTDTVDTTTQRVDTVEKALLGLNVSISTAVRESVKDPFSNLTVQMKELSKKHDATLKFMKYATNQLEKNTADIEENSERITALEQHESHHSELTYLQKVAANYKKWCDNARKELVNINTWSNFWDPQESKKWKREEELYCEGHKRQLIKIEYAELAHNKMNRKSTGINELKIPADIDESNLFRITDESDDA